ncbi:MAG: hypothetical protein IPG06_22940 [Haliea sp.]|nr:hypothetical protein [Haliea sp.]
MFTPDVILAGMHGAQPSRPRLPVDGGSAASRNRCAAMVIRQAVAVSRPTARRDTPNLLKSEDGIAAFIVEYYEPRGHDQGQLPTGCAPAAS